MATSSAMKSSLVLLLLLSAVVASHAHQVSCKNSCHDPIWVNGKKVSPGQLIVVEVVVNIDIDIVVFDTKGGKHSGKYKCPKNARELEFRYNKVTGFLEVRITAVLLLLGDLLGNLLGSVFRILKCNLH